MVIKIEFELNKNKTELASILLNRLAVLKTVKDSPCRLVHRRRSTACLFILSSFVIVTYVREKFQR